MSGHCRGRSESAAVPNALAAFCRREGAGFIAALWLGFVRSKRLSVMRSNYRRFGLASSPPAGGARLSNKCRGPQ